MYKVNRFVNSEVYESIRQEVGDSVLINFTLLSTAYQSTPSVKCKNKTYYHLFGSNKGKWPFHQNLVRDSCESNVMLHRKITDTSIQI